MWYIETDGNETSDNYVSVRVCVEDSIFLSALVDRLKVYPSYIGINTNWWSVTTPYKPYITPFPEDGAVLIRVNQTIRIHLSRIVFHGQKQKLIDKLVTELSSWIDSEYATYQKEWREHAITML